MSEEEKEGKKADAATDTAFDAALAALEASFAPGSVAPVAQDPLTQDQASLEDASTGGVGATPVAEEAAGDGLEDDVIEGDGLEGGDGEGLAAVRYEQALAESEAEDVDLKDGAGGVTKARVLGNEPIAALLEELESEGVNTAGVASEISEARGHQATATNIGQSANSLVLKYTHGKTHSPTSHGHSLGGPFSPPGGRR